MKNIKAFIDQFLPLICCVLLLCGCDDFVDVPLPNSQLTSPTVFEDMATANVAMTSIYSKIRDISILSGYGQGLSFQLGNYTDELEYYEVTQLSADFYNNALSANHRGINDMWTNSYNVIYAANAVIEGVDDSVLLSTANRNQLKGEALFVRGLLHFYLVNLYGDVPYITTTDYMQNSTVGRMPVAEVNASIKADLETSLTLLPENYISNDRVRPNKFVVRALLARLNLYAGAWEEAANDASAVLNATELYEWETDIDVVFLKDSRSTIWQLSPALSGNNTEEANIFIFTSGPPTLSALTSNLVESFDAEDLRRTHWTGEVTDGTSTWYYPYKYKYPLYNDVTMENSILFRLAEQYLIRAEARAHQGDLIGAKEDLNKVRNRAELPDTTALTANEIIKAVLEERRHELFTELGHRFFDLKRTGNLNTVLSPLKPGWDDNDKLLPLPASELQLNPNLLPQNPGY